MTEAGDRLRILVVEDDATNLVLLRAVLSRSADTRLRAAAIAVVGTLADARLAVLDRPELILLDVRLPDGNGLDLARDLAGRADRPRILVLSASVLPADRSAALAAGADGFLSKPYRPADLSAACASLLDDTGRVPGMGWTGS